MDSKKADGVHYVHCPQSLAWEPYLQEVSMVKNMIKDRMDVKYKQVSPLQYLLLVLMVITGLALVYTVTVPGRPAKVRNQVSLTGSGADVQDATNQAVLQWMKKNSDMPEQVLSKIYSVARNSVNTDLILAICLVESNFNPVVESNKGAIGLMGIMPDVWLEELKEQGILKRQEDLYTISSNINSGIYVLEWYLARTNNLRKALSQYAGGDPSYATKVLRMLGEISRTRRSEGQFSLSALRTER
jgi:soluble lytic murein transglycosylase-like protein